MDRHLHQRMFPLGEDKTKYRKLTTRPMEFSIFEGKEIIKVDLEILTELTFNAFRDTSHLYF